MQFRELGEVRLAGQHDHRRPDLAPRRDERGPSRRVPGTERGDRRPLVDQGAVALHGPRQAAHEPARVHDRRVVGHEGPERALDPDALRELRGIDDPVAVPEPEAPVFLERRVERRQALRPARDDDLAAPVEPCIDARLGRRAPDLVDGVVGRLLHPPRRVLAVQLREAVHRDVQVRRAPGAVPPRRPEPGDLTLEDHDPARRVTAVEVERGPQPGQPRAKDRDVGLDGTLERRPRRQVVAGGLEPVGDGRVVGHVAMVAAAPGGGRAVPRACATPE